MPRVARAAPGGIVYHVLNRGNGRLKLFYKDQDYAAFVKLLAEVKEAAPMKVLAYCLMPTHWHLVLHPKHDGDLSNFMLRLSTSHVRRHHAQHHHLAGGHLYQGRFKSFPVQDDAHFLALCRYVEANPLRAKKARRAEAWRWSSLRLREKGEDESGLLDAWPVNRPADWVDRVNAAMPPEELERVRASVVRGRPFGAPAWVARTTKRLGLEYTFRDRGRPKKKEEK